MTTDPFQRLKTAGISRVGWGERNHIAFDNCKEKMPAFTKHWKPDLRQRLTEVRITVSGHTLGFNTEVTRWLRVYLDTGLRFRA